jgi:hypothetical protein
VSNLSFWIRDFRRCSERAILRFPSLLNLTLNRFLHAGLKEGYPVKSYGYAIFASRLDLDIEGCAKPDTPHRQGERLIFCYIAAREAPLGPVMLQANYG